MKKVPLALLFILFTSSILAQDSIYMLLPDKSCSAVKISGEPELYQGDDLFSLINGGAELYHEFGFVEVMAVDLVAGKTPLRAEIYDMGSQEAAWGIFSLSATNKAKGLKLGGKIWLTLKRGWLS